MKKNAICIGERNFEGDYNRILSVGDVNINDSNLKKLYCVGNYNIKNSTIKKVKIVGELLVDSSTLNNATIVGNVRFDGLCKGDTISISGNANAQNLECRLLHEKKNKDGDFDKELCWEGYFKAETFECFHNLNFDFEYDFKNIISSNYITTKNEIVCENFYGLHGVSAPIINCENIFLLTKDNTNVENLVGTNITVKNTFLPDKNFNILPKLNNYHQLSGSSNIICIKEIEGDVIDVEYVNSDYVSGTDVTIGDLCVIKRVEYKNSINISQKAVVEEVVKL